MTKCSFNDRPTYRMLAYLSDMADSIADVLISLGSFKNYAKYFLVAVKNFDIYLDQFMWPLGTDSDLDQ